MRRPRASSLHAITICPSCHRPSSPSTRSVWIADPGGSTGRRRQRSQPPCGHVRLSWEGRWRPASGRGASQGQSPAVKAERDRARGDGNVRVRPCLDARPAPLRRPRRPLARPAVHPLHRWAPRLQRLSKIKEATSWRLMERRARPTAACTGASGARYSHRATL